MLFILLISLLLSIIKAQFLGRLSPQICMSGHCRWICSGNARKCRGIYYCGPQTKSCRMDCPKGGCNDEIALISHSGGETTINCVGESVCTKMIVNCGKVDANYIHELNNLPGTLQTLFENMPPTIFRTQMQAPFGKCKMNCGWKSCKDIHFICQGIFKDGAGCEVNAMARPSFRDASLHCGLPNPKSHCQANCGAARLTQLPSFNQFTTNEIPCENANYICFQGKCYCNGFGCSSADFRQNGYIMFGKAPKYVKPIQNKPNPKIVRPVRIKKNLVKTVAKKKQKIMRPKRVYINYNDQPIKPDFLIGRYTHLKCGTRTCKVICENPRSCSGITIVAGPNVKQFTIECAEESCIGLNVETMAIENDFKCIDHGACAGASFVCGLTKTETVNPNRNFIPSSIKSCKVECQNGGCAKHHNPAHNFIKVKGVRLECNKEVLRCELHADSQNSNFNYPAYNPNNIFFIPRKPTPLNYLPQGSFDKGEFICNVRKFFLPINRFGGNTNNPSGVPTCLLKCSSHIVNKYCTGVKYTCKASTAQCQCNDYCTGHVTECFQNRNLRGDCPKLTFPPVTTTTTTTTTISTTPKTKFSETTSNQAKAKKAKPKV